MFPTANTNHGSDQYITYGGGTTNVHNTPLGWISACKTAILSAENTIADPGLAKLYASVASKALHVSKGRVGRAGVHEGTREGFLGNLGAWIETPVEGSRLYWVYGGAGAGKSAVAQTLCEKYRHTHLAAAYFYSRNDSTRNTMNSFVPTIAYQLSKSPHLDPHLASAIDSKICSEPGILDCDWEEQFQQLIYEPCTQVQPNLWLSLPRLVIIDGLDECMDHNPADEERAGPDLG
ncbi:hypothetical protein V5O48_018047, partial [Marasmius crinis-equi]